MKTIFFDKDTTTRSAIICCTAFLTALGLVSIYSSSAIPGSIHFSHSFVFFSKHAVVALFGFSMIFAMGHLPFRVINVSLFFVLIVSAVLLVCTHYFGVSVNGAKRWIHVYGISIQASELVKISLVFYLAIILSRPSMDVNNVRFVFTSVVLPLGFFSFFLLLQPDYGSVVVIWSISFILLIVAGLEMRRILIVGSSLFVVFLGLAISSPYRLKRLLSFLNPWERFHTDGFQIIQSFLGFQNGGLLGVGFGESKQKLFFLPEAHTDFILAVVGEELGLLGVLAVCGFFMYFCYLCLLISLAQKDIYRRYLAFGLGTMIIVQVLLNLGVAMGALPTKGMALPFISMGANALWVDLFAAAILARIAQEAPLAKDCLR